MPNAVKQSSETIFDEHIMISIMPAVCCVLAFVGMFFYPLSDKKVRENSEQLALKRIKA
jgi:GPH family glycoside/pentoside/hexuronide:cation symporter